jgi:hypothetical protein
MKLNILVLQHSFHKYLFNRDILEKYNAGNLQDFAQTQLDFEFFLDNRHHNVNADGNPDLSFHSVDAGVEKSFDSQVLLDPFEKDFYSPAALVKLCNRRSRQNEVVR